ncbi:MAG TPA: hypothetical protein VE890_12800, partial [Thermoguttaceae bacterium]|nr:hypothetical protein [Thermoguttaceae bacterium]
MQPSPVHTLEFRRVRCSFQAILADALADVRPWAIGKGVEIEHELCGTALDSICTDPDHLQQLLVGLISSAVRRTAANTLCLLARADRSAGTPMKIHIDVLDPLTKITRRASAETLPRDTRSPDEEQPPTPPRGLGFAAWTRIARLLGGDLATSRLGTGTRYRLTIAAGPTIDEGHRPRSNRPGSHRSKAKKTTESRQFGESLPADQRQSVLRDRHVLLVEDDPDHRPLFALMLRRAGCRVTVAE